MKIPTSSPFAAINDLGPMVTISDFGNNNGLVVGPAIANWREVDINAWPVELRIDGEVIGEGTAAGMLDGPFGAARFLFELMAERGIALRSGQWISTGAVTGRAARRMKSKLPILALACLLNLIAVAVLAQTDSAAVEATAVGADSLTKKVSL